MHELIEYFLFILEFMLAKSLKNECVRSKAYLIFMFIQTALRPKLFNSWEFRFSDLNFWWNLSGEIYLKPQAHTNSCS